MVIIYALLEIKKKRQKQGPIQTKQLTLTHIAFEKILLFLNSQDLQCNINFKRIGY